MKQEQPFLGVIHFSAFPWSYTISSVMYGQYGYEIALWNNTDTILFYFLVLRPFLTRIAAHGLVSGYGICGKAQAQLESALEYKTGL
ncbi:hypothetical protein GLOIN_2v1786247 [Rhizophagus irregularis DAOM 181602=DAOM 197198]|uniref:Uncharacterized protein n=1 Tax=Rhizophagus irregularis (strain DAOM 181602 / DAOM 197198 / MUCL 43194) TaxID=747089 RepID=A0A2P4P8I8_RHIID|nr:hypothetical protein GLOIN_2v1786247 [Rhizophagus irregularis DAOM 181602=DAOM 197198]POG61694.1 hypothetical protein GLOIN_2v1786247 [Rhizophagus irregularis DAOM 181602=DAOM 197198]|eukprot:XP_025168560.1 hypothetical protein GLOIN_2v1786247 [Rhizophagus irregularis DAOM 181602=DAOM 197198]